VRQLCTLALLVGLCACEKVASPTAEYRPEEAGTVDRALCLLGFTAIPLKTLLTGHHLVDATLNGRDATFILDTGANGSVLHHGFADDFSISQRATGIGGVVGIGAGGMGKAIRASIDDLSLGPVRIRQGHIMMTDLSQLVNALRPLSGQTIHGLIGQDVMNEHRAVIDVEGDILYLMEADQEPAPLPVTRCRPDGSSRNE
jgi:hypothetical protein